MPENDWPPTGDEPATDIPPHIKALLDQPIYVGRDRLLLIAAAIQGAMLTAMDGRGLRVIASCPDRFAVAAAISLIKDLGYSEEATHGSAGVSVDSYSDGDQTLWTPEPRRKISLWRRLLRRVGL